MRPRDCCVALLALLLAGCRPPAPAPAEVPPPAATGLSPAQQSLQQLLSRQLAAGQPTHRLTLRNGRSVDGQLLAENARAVRFRERDGLASFITASYDRNTIRRLEPIPAGAFTITDDDVRLADEFPGFHFLKLPPYSIVTDESYSEVEKIIRILADLRHQFEEKFAPLISTPAATKPIQVVLFAREPAFREYTRRTAPGLLGSAGFFSHADNRLVLLNQLGTTRYHDFQTKLDARAQRVTAEPRTRQHLAAWRSQVALEARALNERLIRHEGAHQLFENTGIHSATGIEPTWLTEGLAQYCEPATIGRRHGALAARLATFRHRDALVPLRDLLNHRDEAGFFALGEGQVEIAYAQSWALVYLLMQDQWRDRFLDLLRHYRTEATADAEPAHILCDRLGVTFAELDAAWQTHLKRL